MVLLAAMVICAVLGIFIERFAYRPLRGGSKLTVLITAIGVSLLLENAGQFFGAEYQSRFPSLFPTRNLNFGGLVLSSNQLAVFVVAIILLIGLHFIVQKTKIGTAMRALSFNPTRRRRWWESTMTSLSRSRSALARRSRRRAGFCIR